MTGLVIAAENQGFLDAHVQKLFENPDAPIDPNRIPIQDVQHYNDLLAHGGVLFNGRLLLPELLTDPVGLLTTLNLELPENPFEPAAVGCGHLRAPVAGRAAGERAGLPARLRIGARLRFRRDHRSRSHHCPRHRSGAGRQA